MANLASRAEVVEAMAHFGARGNAVDAMTVGLFAFAALEPSALLGPVQLLIGGPGAGLHGIDGRLRQPGLGAPRPRGFVRTDEIPVAAKVAAQTFSAALLAALGAYGTRTALQCLEPALELAKAQSAERAALLKTLGRQGPTAWTLPEIATPLLSRFGRLQGGLLTAEDLQPTPPVLSEVTVSVEGNREIATLAHEGAYASPRGRMGWLLAVDTHGLFCAAALELHDDGVEVGELGLRAPLLFAEPVRRGQTRVTPGALLPSTAPLALVGQAGSWELALINDGGDFQAGLDRVLALNDAPELQTERRASSQATVHLLFRSGSSRVLSA